METLLAIRADAIVLSLAEAKPVPKYLMKSVQNRLTSGAEAILIKIMVGVALIPPNL